MRSGCQRPQIRAAHRRGSAPLGEPADGPRCAAESVYRTSAGFDDAYVAAPSRAAALKAWGARGDLFAIGEAEVITDAALTAEPLAHPGEVVRRPRGDMAAMLAAAPKVARSDRAGTQTKDGERALETPPLPPPHRSALTAAEQGLRETQGRLAHEVDAIAQEWAELGRRERRTRDAGAAELKGLSAFAGTRNAPLKKPRLVTTADERKDPVTDRASRLRD